MLTTPGLLLQDIMLTLAIALPCAAAAAVFYYLLRRLAHRMAGKTGTALDNMLVEAMKWPIFASVIIVGAYFAILQLPFKEAYAFEIRRGFHVVFNVLIAYGVASLLDGLFRWFKLEVTSKTRTALDKLIVPLLRVIIPLLAVLLVVLVSLELFNIDTEGVTTWLGVHGTRIGLVSLLAVVALFIFGFAGSKAITAIVARRGLGQSEEEVQKRANTLTAVLITTGQVFIIFVAVFVILSEMGIDIAPVLAGAGVIGIAIGFGAQSLVKDLIAGLFIIMEDQYRVGDVVRIADIAGLVEEITLRRTVLRDMDGIVHIVPNGEIRVASNFTKEWSRVNLNISVSYGTDLDRAIAVINRVCDEMAKEPAWAPLILKTPQVLRVDKLGDSGIELKVLGDTKPIRQWDVMGEIRKRVKKAFDEEGIEIPWPHTKVYFGDMSLPNVSTVTREGKKE